MTLPADYLAAREYLATAREDMAKGFHPSACLTAQKAAEVALQSWLRTRGLSASGADLPGLLAAVPGRTPELEAGAAELERFRIDMSSPYRSAPGPEPEATADAALVCCVAAGAIVAHVERLFAEAGEQ